MMPFIMSSSPPPIDECEDEEEDEFGDFRGADHTFSLTDLNEMNDTLEIEEAWVEPLKNKQSGSPDMSASDVNVADSSGASIPSMQPAGKADGSGSEAVAQWDAGGCHAEERGVERDVAAFEGAREADSSAVGAGGSEEALAGRTEKWEPHEKSVSGIQIQESGVISDDFSDFTDFTCGSEFCSFHKETAADTVADTVSGIPPKSELKGQAQDDFDEFDDFESAEFKSCPIKEEPSVEEILKMMFANPNNHPRDLPEWSTATTDSLHLCLDDSSSVWGHLKELETSHALSYQWTSSTANKTLLSSLNIDCRNILIGARWNLCVPRFAANLGMNPLEPVKAADANSFSQPIALSPRATTEDVVPAAQFDWTGSGLTNPLDGLEKENAAAAPEEAPVQAVVDTLKPIVDDFFGSIGEDDSVLLPCAPPDPPTASAPSRVSSSADPGPRRNRKEEMSEEAFAIVDSFPDLSFLSARKLMHAADENMSRFRVRP